MKDGTSLNLIVVLAIVMMLAGAGLALTGGIKASLPPSMGGRGCCEGCEKWESERIAGIRDRLVGGAALVGGLVLAGFTAIREPRILP